MPLPSCNPALHRSEQAASGRLLLPVVNKLQTVPVAQCSKMPEAGCPVCLRMLHSQPLSTHHARTGL